MTQTADLVCNYLYADPGDVVNIYPYGSKVYGTASEASDDDYIVIFKDGVKLPEHGVFFFDFTSYTVAQFEERIQAHDISALECLWLPTTSIVKHSRNFLDSWMLDLPTLRESIASKASNSFVKAKKKFTVEKDRNSYLARKSLFHSLRILKFGMQIASAGMIHDYRAANAIWESIKDYPSEDWEDYKTTYQPLYNELKTAFRELAPKA